MTPLQIECFLLVAQENSISRAAEKLFVSQPAVSKHLSQLEDELGIKLFIRKNNSLAITPAGRMFRDFFLDIRERYNELLKLTQREQYSLGEHYHLGFIEGWDISPFYPPLYQTVTSLHPSTQFHVYGCDLDQALNGLRTGALDSALMLDRLLEGHPELSLTFLGRVESMVITSSSSPFAQKPDLCIEDFANETFIVSAPKGTKTAEANYIAIRNAFKTMPKIEYADNLSAAYIKVQSGQGVMLKTNFMQSRNNSLFFCFPVGYSADLYFATWKSKENPPLNEVNEEIIRCMKSLMPDGILKHN